VDVQALEFVEPGDAGGQGLQRVVVKPLFFQLR